MLTEKDYCDYDTCVALKELGYKGISRFFYATKESPLRRYSYDQILTTRIADAVGHTLAISLYGAQKWLREERYLHIEVRWYSNLWYEYEVKEAEGNVIAEGCAYPTYEEALSTAVRIAVEWLKRMKMEGCKCKPAKSYAERIIEYQDFISLVKRMREAQNEERKWGIVNFKTEEDKVACGEAIRRMYQLESEVDEYLKKMES